METCKCTRPKDGHWHHDRDQVLSIVQRTPWTMPINQDIKLQIWSIPYVALLPHPNIEKYIEENPKGAYWQDLSELEDGSGPYTWVPEYKVTHLAGSMTIPNKELFGKDKEHIEQIYIDQETNMIHAMFLELCRIESYTGKAPEQLEAERQERQRRYEAGPHEPVNRN